MKLFRSLSIALVFACLHNPAALAHSGGHKAISDEQALEVATDVVTQLTSRDVGLGFGQIDASWNNLPKDRSRLHTKERRYYIVSVENAQEGRTLYILMSPGGDVYDANFTGEFSQLK